MRDPHLEHRLVRRRSPLPTGSTTATSPTISMRMAPPWLAVCTWPERYGTTRDAARVPAPDGAGWEHSRPESLPPAPARTRHGTVGARWDPSCRRCSARCRATSSRPSPGARPTSTRSPIAARRDRTRPRDRLRMAAPDHAADRRGTAATLRAIDAAHGGGFFAVPEQRELELEAADAAFARRRAGDRRADAPRGPDALGRRGRGRARRVPAHGRSRSGGRARSTRASSTARRGPRSCSARRRPRSRCSRRRPVRPTTNVLTNAQIAAARDVVDRYAGTGPRAHAHDRAPQPRPGRARRDGRVARAVSIRRAGRCTRSTARPRRRRRPAAGSSTTTRSASRSSNGSTRSARASSPRTRASAVRSPSKSVAAASPRDIGPAAAAFPNINFVVYHSGYERDPDGQEGAYDAAAPQRAASTGLIKSLELAGIGADGNVYAELGSTWFLMLRRPVEAAHVLGKLLVALGPDRIVWGTDSTWYGSPQPLIDAFRAFTIPERMQAEFGYPALTAAREGTHPRARTRRRSTASPTRPCARPMTARDRAWVTNASTALQRAIADCSNAGGPRYGRVRVGVVIGTCSRSMCSGAARQEERAHVVAPHSGRRSRSPASARRERDAARPRLRAPPLP